MTTAPSTTPAAVAALRWFPLVARPRLRCASLEDRLVEITDLIRDAETVTEPVALLAVAHNKAALLASDQHHSGLASELCWHHHRRYPLAPRSERGAKLALEPLVNLARLALRSNDPDHGIGILRNLLHGAGNGDHVVVDGEPVRLDHSQLSAQDRRSVHMWLWMMLLEEGTRGLARAGRWVDALSHTEAYRGIGQRLLDGRQVAVAAHLHSGDHDRADDLIVSSTVAEPWERAVATALAAASKPGPDRRDAMIESYLSVRLDSRHIFFTTRLGLAVIDIAGGPHGPRIGHVVDTVRRQALDSGDAYTALQLDGHPIRDCFTTAERDLLTSVTTLAGLQSPASPDVAERIRKAVTW